MKSSSKRKSLSLFRQREFRAPIFALAHLVSSVGGGERASKKDKSCAHNSNSFIYCRIYKSRLTRILAHESTMVAEKVARRRLKCGAGRFSCKHLSKSFAHQRKGNWKVERRVGAAPPGKQGINKSFNMRFGCEVIKLPSVRGAWRRAAKSAVSPPFTRARFY